MKLFFQLLLVASILSFQVPGSFAQSHSQGAVKGKILTSDRRPAENVSVSLKGTRYGVATNEDGEFSIKAPAGNYILVVSHIGIKNVERNITITASESLTIPAISIGSSISELDVVSITRNKGNRLVVKKTPYVAKMPLSGMENPQVYSTVTKELLAQQINTSFSDALRNSPGLDELWSSTGRANDGAAYYSLRGFSIQPTLINGIAGISNGDLDPANMERIEVIKGPSGTLFGGALINFGGLINVVTKRPLDTVGGQVGYSGGNFGLSRLTADVYGPLSADSNLTGRVNVAYHHQNSFQDAGFRKSFFVAPSLRYRASEKLTFDLDAEFYQFEGTNQLMVFLNRSRQLIARTPSELNFDFHRSYTNNDVTYKNPTANIRGLATYKIGGNWTSQTSFSSSNRKTDGFNQYVMYLDKADTLLNRYASLLNSTSRAINAQQNFTGDFKIAGLRNRLVVGLDFLNQITENNNSPYALFDQVSSVRNDPRYSKINKTALLNAIAADPRAYTINRTVNNVYSAYASDVLNLTDQLLAMLSVRVDRFEDRTTDFKQTSVSPKFGVVYQVVKDQVSLFGNYMNGFRNVAPVTQPLPEYSGSMKPQHANQIEGGVKLDVFDGRLNLTASYYNISVDNMLRTESIVRDGKPYNITFQDGTQRSEGFDVDLIASPLSGLNIVAGYSHNESKLNNATSFVQGRRPVTAGPKDLANLWVSYTQPRGPLKGLGAGFGGNYAARNIITSDSRTGDFVLPAYTVLNTTVFYDTRKFRLGVKVDNLTDKDYFKGWTTVEPQQPRSVVANLTLKF